VRHYDDEAIKREELIMKAVNTVALILLVVGGLNWGLVGLFDFNLVAALFGDGSALSRVVYVLVGLSAIWTAFAAITHRAMTEATN
jgi:uncharacterized membrane protein YuzA (DUF378 family)